MLVVIGGIIAFIGDRIGMKVGKKRLSIFGLRPKHTSMLITVITGIVVAATSVLVMSIVSQDVGLPCSECMRSGHTGFYIRPVVHCFPSS